MVALLCFQYIVFDAACVCVCGDVALLQDGTAALVFVVFLRMMFKK